MFLYDGVDAMCGFGGIFAGLCQQFGPLSQGEKGSKLMLPMCVHVIGW